MISISLSDQDKARDLLVGAPAVAELLASAPAEVRTDMIVVTSAVSSLAGRLDAVGYDLARLSAGSVMSLQAPAVIAAAGRIDAWTKRTC